MVKVDLITGFLGSGKTTFLTDYAAFLAGRGERVAVIVNDHGAINVDRLLLDDALKDSCRLEMVIGGDSDCRRRRLKTKLIAMGMGGYDRVILEPSGIFDVDEFFDMLFEEPLDRWYEIGNVLAIVEASPDRELSNAGRYLLASQVAKAGKVIVSKGEENSEEARRELMDYLNESLELFQCRRRISEKNIYFWKLGEISEEDYTLLSKSGYNSGEMVRLPIDETEAFDSLFYFHVKIEDTTKLKEVVESIISDEKNGNIIRLKGFIRKNPDDPNSGWLEVNATPRDVDVRPIPVGQELFIIIGENLNKERIGSYWMEYRNEV